MCTCLLSFALAVFFFFMLGATKRLPAKPTREAVVQLPVAPLEAQKKKKEEQNSVWLTSTIMHTHAHTCTHKKKKKKVPR